ncbi:hypothetical protein ACFFIA_30275, partial [Phytohabitans kaempferiae]
PVRPTHDRIERNKGAPMSDHGWWPDDIDPESSPDLDLPPDLASTADFDFTEAETADLSDFDHLGPDESLDSMVDAADPTAPPIAPPTPPIDPAGDSTVDVPGGPEPDGLDSFEGVGIDAQGVADAGGGPDGSDGLDGGEGDPDGSDGGGGDDPDGPDTGGSGGGGGDGPDGPAGGGDDSLDPGDASDDGVTPVGADPDLDAHADTWTEQSFPEPLDLETPEPVDGFPWTDPTTLGSAPLPDADAAYQGAPEPSDLAAYAGQELPSGADPWTALSASDDPATSSLARWWSPEA